MITALILGRGGSVGFPGKNTYEVLNRPLMEYPILAAQHTPEIDEIYVSTDSYEIKNIAKKNGCSIIDRPDYLCTSEAKHEDAMVHGYEYVKGKGKDIEMVVLLQCNAPFILAGQLSDAIKSLRERPDVDSAATISEYSAFTPSRARLLNEDGTLKNFLDAGLLEGAGSDRKSQGKIYFTDGSFVVRARCLENIEDGMLPYRWMGQSCVGIENWGGFDVDEQWQIPQVEAWLIKHGFTEGTTPYDRT